MELNYCARTSYLLPMAQRCVSSSEYTDLRIEFYLNRDDNQRKNIDERTTQLQADLWSAVRAPSASTASTSGGGTLASCWHEPEPPTATGCKRHTGFGSRLPSSRFFMAIIALCSNALMGYRSQAGKLRPRLAFTVPLIISFAFLLIADIDAPRHGLIEVRPQNLESLANSSSPVISPASLLDNSMKRARQGSTRKKPLRAAWRLSS